MISAREPIGDEGRRHLAVCDRCRQRWALGNLRREVLEASRWTDPIEEPQASFYYALGRRLRGASSREMKSLWLPTVRFARSFMAVAISVLVILTGLNLYLVRRPSKPVVRMDSYWRDTTGDGEALVLSDEALTHEQVLTSLRAMRDDNEKQH